MRIEQLEYLAAVTQHGSLRRASERLHLSQPALSEAISKLERELGVTLLDRRRTGARISRQGRDLQQYMVEVLEAVDRLRTAAGDQSRRPRCSGSAPSTPPPRRCWCPRSATSARQHPGTTVEVVNTQQDEIYQGLAEGALDLGLVNVLPGDDVPPGAGGQRARARPARRGAAAATTRWPASTRSRRGSCAAEPFVAMRPATSCTASCTGSSAAQAARRRTPRTAPRWAS